MPRGFIYFLCGKVAISILLNFVNRNVLSVFFIHIHIVVGHLLEDLTIDLSEFANELIKVLGGQLLAKDEENQMEAVFAIKSLAKQCSDKDSVRFVLKHLFDVLNGEGKLATVNQKLAILSSIGNCSFNCCQVNTLEIYQQLIQLFADYLKNETNESTLVFALSQLSIWLSTLKAQTTTSDLIGKLNDFFKVKKILC